MTRLSLLVAALRGHAAVGITGRTIIQATRAITVPVDLSQVSREVYLAFTGR